MVLPCFAYDFNIHLESLQDVSDPDAPHRFGAQLLRLHRVRPRDSPSSSEPIEALTAVRARGLGQAETARGAAHSLSDAISWSLRARQSWGCSSSVARARSGEAFASSWGQREARRDATEPASCPSRAAGAPLEAQSSLKQSRLPEAWRPLSGRSGCVHSPQRGGERSCRQAADAMMLSTGAFLSPASTL